MPSGISPIISIVGVLFFVFASANAGASAGEDEYIAAHVAERDGKYADAIALYDKSASASAQLAPFAKVRAAACRAKGGDPGGAEKALRESVKHDKEEPASLMARAELASLLERAGKYADAAQLLERIMALPFTPKWLYPYRQRYGDCLIHLPEAKRAAKGYAVFADILAEARTRPQRLAAAQRLAGSPDLDQRMQAVAVYVNAGEWADAAKTLTGLEPLFTGKLAQYQPQIDYARARIQLGTESDKELGRAALLSVAKTHADTEFGRLALSHAARSYWTAGQEPKVKPKKEPAAEAQRRQTFRDTAQKLLELMTTQLAGTAETGDTLWWLANQYAERIDDPESQKNALTTYLQLATTCPQHERAPDALYRAAELFDAQGLADKARECQLNLLDRFPTHAYAPGAAFECGRIALAAKDAKSAEPFFTKAIELGGVGSFYAHRASQCLSAMRPSAAPTGQPVPAPGVGAYLYSIAVDVSSSPSPQANEAWVELVRFFAANGLEEAEWEALGHAPQLMDPALAGPYLKALADAGLAATVKSIIDVTQWGMANARPQPQLLPILYPRAYWESVQATAQETGEDPLMLLSIARQESLFQARIESHAGAAGVMQLMPSTAAWLVKSDPSVGVAHAEDLFVPANSIRVGGYYYRYILQKHGGNAVFAVASYNAGPGNVSKWRARFGEADLDRFIELIPFDETRDFVKKVLGNYAAYYSIYGVPGKVADRTK